MKQKICIKYFLIMSLIVIATLSLNGCGFSNNSYVQKFKPETKTPDISNINPQIDEDITESIKAQKEVLNATVNVQGSIVAAIYYYKG